MGVKEGGIRSDIKVAGLSNWKNEWRYIKRWQEDQVLGGTINGSIWTYFQFDRLIRHVK